MIFKEHITGKVFRQRRPLLPWRNLLLVGEGEPVKRLTGDSLEIIIITGEGSTFKGIQHHRERLQGERKRLLLPEILGKLDPPLHIFHFSHAQCQVLIVSVGIALDFEQKITVE